MTEAYSSDTGRSYPTWDELVSAEANGYCVVAILITDKGRAFPYVKGTYPTNAEAKRAQRRFRRQLKRQLRGSKWPELSGVWIRPIWKDDRGL